MSITPRPRRTRSAPAARRLARTARLQASAQPYAGTLAGPGTTVSALADACPRNLHLRATVRALACEFSTARPIYNSRGVRIG